MTNYDAAILEAYAEDLYSRAKWIVVSTALLYTIVAGVLLVIGCALMKMPGDEAAFFSTAGAILGCLIGIRSGQAKAFQLRLEAQTVLCQRQVELNTRPRP